MKPRYEGLLDVVYLRHLRIAAANMIELELQLQRKFVATTAEEKKGRQEWSICRTILHVRERIGHEWIPTAWSICEYDNVGCGI